MKMKNLLFLILILLINKKIFGLDTDCDLIFDTIECKSYNKSLYYDFRLMVEDILIRYSNEWNGYSNLIIKNKNIPILDNFVFQGLVIEDLDLSCNEIEQIQENSLSGLLVTYRLDLSNNKIKSIENLFKSLRFQSIEIIDLSYNLIENFNHSITLENSKPKVILNNNKITQLKANMIDEVNIIFLSDNLIHNIESGTFDGLIKLERIYLSRNRIQVVKSHSFIGLDNLEIIKLDGNKLKLIEAEAFINNPKLNLIDIQFNLIDFLSKDSFVIDNQSIEWNCTLLMNFNNIKVINSSTIEGLKDSAKLTLMSNTITEIDSYSFFNFKKLKSLKISDSFIKNITKNSFFGLSLELLYLSTNRIEILTNYTFNGSSCFILKLNSNLIHTIGINAFKGIKNLKNLDLSENYIKSIDTHALLPLASLTYFDLSKNKIQKVKSNNFIFLKNLDFLNLSFNKINKISKDSFDGLSNLESIDLSNNLIEIIKPIYFMNLVNLKVFNLSSNRVFNIDRNFFSNLKFLNHLDLSFNVLSITKFILPPNITYLNLKSNQIINSFLSLKQIVDLDLSENQIEFVDFSKFKNMKNLNLHGNRISSILLNTFYYDNIIHLYLSFNRIVDIDFVINMSNLIELDLSNNKIETIKKSYFLNKDNLKVLNLSNNIIKFIELESFYFRSNIKELSLNNISYKFDISINFTNDFNSNNKEQKCISLANNEFRDVVLEEIIEFSDDDSMVYGYLSPISLNISNSKMNELKLKNLYIISLDISFYKGDMENMSSNVFRIQAFQSFELRILNLKLENLNVNSFEFIISTFDLTSIEKLEMNHNLIENLNISQHLNLPQKLNEIDLSFNRIEFINQFTFYFCNYLKKLNLINNRLKSFDINLMSSLITDIKLSHNHIEQIDAYNILNDFNALKVLDFSHNKITSLDFLLNFFLEKFDMKNVDLFNEKISITTLVLSNNLFQNVYNEVFQKVYYLTYLDMNSNLIQNINSDSFINTPYLEYLDLSKNKLKELNQTIFNGLNRLEYLNLSINKIIYLNNEIFNDLKNLKILDISNNCLKQISTNIFNSLIDLNYLYINTNKNLTFNRDCFLKLKSINQIWIDYEMILSDHNKQVFISSLKSEPVEFIKDIGFFKSVNLVYKNNSIINCRLALIFIKYNILVNLLHDKQVEYFLQKCHNISLT